MTFELFLASQAQQGGGLSMVIMMIAIFVIMWFFMIRPQQKRQKEIRNFQNSLQEGTKIVTSGGIYGTVKRVNVMENTLDIEVAKGIVITVDKGSVFKDATASKESTQTK